MAYKYNNLTGQRFGRLLVIAPTKDRMHRNIVWECKCDCGNTAYVITSSLVSGTTNSCGCLRKDHLLKLQEEKYTSPTKPINHTKNKGLPTTSWKNIKGEKFGMLTPVRPTDMRERGNVVWECLCDCGNTTYMCVTNLKRGKQPSCGCLRGDIEDLSGQKFGKLTAIRHLGLLETGPVTWECKCTCGNRVFVISRKLKDGSICSCGCE